jgi:hypothetical protein
MAAMESRGRVTRSEWRWALAWAIVALIISSVPYLLGAAMSSNERVFGGFVMGVEDGYSYLAKMGQGARGAWLFHDVYTSEPHDGALFFLFHILLGKVSAAASGLGGWPLTETMVVVYHIARVALGIVLLLTVYRFAAEFTASRAIRRLTLLIVAFSGGLGWLLLLVGQPEWLGGAPIDLILPEGFTFLVLYGLPHIALGRILLLAGFILLWGANAAHSRATSAALAGVCWLGMGLAVPFYVAVAWAVAVAAWLAVTIRRRKIDWPETWQAALACAVAAPVVLYSLAVFTLNPVMRQWSAQNLILSPHPLHYVMGYALVGLLAVGGVAYVLRRRDEMLLRLFAWVVVVLPLLYLPFNLQRRLIEGWQIPLVILAALGLVRFVLPAWSRTRLVRWLIRFPRYSVRGLVRWAVTLLILALVPTNVLLLGSASVAVIARAAPIFRDGGEVRALDWLAARATYADVVLATYAAGNYVPARVGARAFIGLGTETAHLEDKQTLVERFFDPSTSDEWRASFLRQYGITYVFAGPLEQFAPGSTRALLPVYQSGEYTIYQAAVIP